MADVRVKVCGLTRFQDAELAVKLGSWGLGFIFVSSVPELWILWQ